MEKPKFIQWAQDGWQNLMTGAGKVLTDKRVNTTFALTAVLTQQELSQMYRGEGVSKKIVDIPVSDMTRTWFNIEGDSENKIIKKLDELKTRQSIVKALKWARLFGGSIMIIGANDGNRRSNKAVLERPLNETKLKSLEFFRVYDRNQITWDTDDIDNDTSSENYGKPKLFKITPIVQGASSEFKVHYTRVIRFIGEELPERESSMQNWWGDSILQSCYTRLRGFGNALISTEAILDEFIVGILTIENLQDLIAAGQEDLITKRLQQIDMSKHILNTMLVDKDEEFTRISASVNGIKDILTFLKDVVSSVAGIPQIKLFGEQSKGLGSQASGNIRMYYDDINEKQKNELEPPLRRIVSLLLASSSFETPEGIKEDWSINFNPLWQESDKEIAEGRLLIAKADDLYVKDGVLTPTEVSESRFGGETYSTDTKLQTEGNAFRKKAEIRLNDPKSQSEGIDEGTSGKEGEPGTD